MPIRILYRRGHNSTSISRNRLEAMPRCLQKLKEDGVISTRGLKEDAFLYGELVFDVNTAYFS